MSSRYSGLFITVEGIDGAGKSTHLPHIESVLTQKGLAVIRTREPGGTASGDLLRNLLLEHPFTPESELMLMFAARQEHITQVIRPALAEGKCVLCDRFTDSSYAYQGGGRGIDANVIQTLENWIQHDLNPDLTLFFDLPVEISLERRAARNEANQSSDRFESEPTLFFERVRQAYMERVRQQPHRFYVINSAESIDTIQSRLSDFLHDWLQCYTVEHHHMDSTNAVGYF